MDESNLSSPCKECTGEGEVQLHAEVDHLRRHLGERDVHILALEAEYLKTNDKVNFLEDQLATWREKYDRVYDSHKRVQKLNQVLEEKLLQMVDRMKTEKSQLTKDIATLSVRLAESKHNYSMLHKENERYKNDMNLAIQLLQCKPDHFVSHKLDNLPVDTQARVSQYVMSKTKGSGSNQSKNGNELESFDASEYEFNISASLMSKILEDSIHDTVTKHCDTCTCSNTHTKPFCYDGTHYSIATQTYLSGEMKNSLCLTCNSDVKSQHSNLSFRSASPHVVKLVNDIEKAGPLYILSVPSHETQPQLKPEVLEFKPEVLEDANICDVVSNDVEDLAAKTEVAEFETKELIPTVEEEMIPIRNNSVNMEPTVHHKLCDRTRTPISSKNSNSLVYDDVMKDMESKKPKIIRSDNQNADIVVGRKNSLSSMGAASMSSSAAKSTSSTHKSNTQVGPGPRFCSLRMQAGSKNILLDNAQPDIPPILYRRQSKCNEVSIYKELNDNINNFIEMEKNNDIVENGFKNESVVVETTLIDVHVESNKEQSAVVKNTGINPVLMNVSSSPLQPLKTHNFSNSSEQNNNQAPVVGNINNTQVDNLLNDFNAVVDPVVDNRDAEGNVITAKTEEQWPTDLQEVKIFNFDRYEQNKLSSQYKPLRKIDMSQLHSLENTKISKDLPPQGDLPKISVVKKDAPKTTLPTVVNVYPNLTQTHLKVNDKKKAFTNEQSTSSLSSDDSATILQKQQLLRVAEWVEQNLEQQNNFNDPLTLEEDVPFNAKAARRESRISRLTATLNELALNMPHPVSKYSAYPRDGHKSWVNPETHKSNQSTSNSITKAVNVAKETEFPVEVDTATSYEKKDDLTNMSMTASDFEKNLNDVLLNGDKQITPEDLARMEYNVKKFLLSGPQWANPESVRSRHTSSKTETDV